MNIYCDHGTVEYAILGMPHIPILQLLHVTARYGKWYAIKWNLSYQVTV